MTPHSLIPRFSLILVIVFLLDLYIFAGVRSTFSSIRIRLIVSLCYWGITVAFYLMTIYMLLSFSKDEGPAVPAVKWTMSLFILLYVPKIVLLFFFGMEDIYRLIRAGGVRSEERRVGKECRSR